MATALPTFLLAAALALGACAPHGAHLKTPTSERPISSELSVVLDEKQVASYKDGTTRLAGRGAGVFKVVATAPIERHPFPGENIIAVLTSGERVLKQAPFVFDARSGRAHVEIPGPGTYRLEMWADNKFIVGNTFVAASLPTLDGQRALELHQQATPQLYLTKDNLHIAGKVRWSHWDSIETDAAFIAEWWHDGTQISTARTSRSTFQRDALLRVQMAADTDAFADEPLWRFASETFELPDQTPYTTGHWELRIYRDDHPALAFGFDVFADRSVRGAEHRAIHTGHIELDVSPAKESKDATRALAKLPHTKFEGAKTLFLPVTVTEVRALARSGLLRGQRARLNMLQRMAPRGASDQVEKDETPQIAEIKKLVPTMQKLIVSMGEPWTDDERP